MKLRSSLGLLCFVLVIGCTKFSPGKVEAKLVALPTPTSGLLTQAAALGDLASVKDLLKQGSDINENLGTADEAVTPLLAAISQGHEDIASFLIVNGAAQHPSFHGFTAKDFASHRNQKTVMDLIGRRGQ